MVVAPKTILYVDDAPDDVLLFQRALQHDQVACNLQTVSKVLAAKSYLIGKAPYDDRTRFPIPSLLVTDATIRGEESSLELISWLRSQPELERLPIICLTGNDNPAIAHQFANFGIKCTQKTTDMQEAAQIVKALLEETR